MPWFRMDIHWYEDPKIEAAATASGPLVLSLFPVLLAKAKAQANGGKVEFTWRKLAHELFVEEGQTREAVEALASAGVLSCPHVSALSAVVAFDPMSWRRWQEAARKAARRQEVEAA